MKFRKLLYPYDSGRVNLRLLWSQNPLCYALIFFKSRELLVGSSVKADAPIRVSLAVHPDPPSIG
jgi:hypothetical protein